MALAFLLLALALLGISIVTRGNGALESVPDLERAMYRVIQGSPCVRLLSMQGESGCANPGRDKIVAPLQRLTKLEFKTKGAVAVLLPYSLFHSFLDKTLHDPSFAAQVAGALVEFADNANRSVNSNPDSKFPLAEFAPYSNKTYQWNPLGTDVLQKRYNFPVYLLSPESTRGLREIAAENEARNAKYPLQVAEFDVVMQTTKSGTHTSESCLKEGSCLPLGGYSILSSFSSITSKPTLLVLAAMDSISFFRDFTPGADSPLSGLISLLAAVDALSKADGIHNATKQVVFLVCNGEAWGYLGSRRFLFELEYGGGSAFGFNMSHIDQILEIGSVGQAVEKTFYGHVQDKHASASTKEIVASLKRSAESVNAQITTASSENPGIPPSSMMSFVQKSDSLTGVLLEEFDTSFKNKFYHSLFDNADNLNPESIVAASSIVARAIYQLAMGDSSAKLDSVAVNSSLVKDLISCLLTPDPGMNCPLVTGFITPAQPVSNHYVGVVTGAPSPTPSDDLLDDTTRFIWNFLADRTRRLDAGECSKDCKGQDQVCVGATGQGRGSCVVSTTRYVPAYSTRLRYKSGNWELLPVGSGDFMDSIDPVWTESFWKSLTLRVYQQERPSLNGMLLLAGCSVTVASAVSILATRALFRKRLKSA
ncbi:nicastrin [Selaginella moellendorffii]|uniref:nicastrin n=1 Tax=Selaginella moellendorffii TaxID=88036 RepID=UPI000D1C4B97|nr:nicastrin [Selaginella moellendorffii]|eukprot:XP_024531033.1 nicastrin [Selaginella moellendorffii]